MRQNSRMFISMEPSYGFTVVRKNSKISIRTRTANMFPCSESVDDFVNFDLEFSFHCDDIDNVNFSIHPKKHEIA